MLKIENNIEDINLINHKIKKCKCINSDFKFEPHEENQLNSFLEKIKNFGETKEMPNLLIDSLIITTNEDAILKMKDLISQKFKDPIYEVVEIPKFGIYRNEQSVKCY